MTNDPRSELLACAQDPDGDIASGALWLAAEDCEDVDVEGALHRIGEVAEQIRERAAGLRHAELADVIASTLRTELGLRGAGGGDPQAHYLHRVLQRGAGVPIACCAIWVAAGRRAGFEVEGVALPGHFVVRVDGVLVDAFTGGGTLDDGSIRRIVGNALGSEPTELDPLWLMRASNRSMLARMSRNLRGCYVARERWEMALRSADRCVALLPDEPIERRDRGLLCWRLGQAGAAARDLRDYLDAVPEATDRSRVEEVLQRMRAQLN